MGSRDPSPPHTQERERRESPIPLPILDERRFMKDFNLPMIEEQPSAIRLNDAQQNYELKN